MNTGKGFTYWYFVILLPLDVLSAIFLSITKFAAGEIGNGVLIVLAGIAAGAFWGFLIKD